MSMASDPSEPLPIFHFKDDLISAIKEFQILVVVGETGSGKTTQLPQYIRESMPSAKIVVTQPRRIAAISAAARVAEETQTRLGDLVGYTIRFESLKSQNTQILYMTDGTMLRSLSSLSSSDNSATFSPLSACDMADVVILDEAHERSLDTDVLFGLMKSACEHNPNLKLIVMSATLDAEKFCIYFGNAPLFSIPGRVFPVQSVFAEKVKMGALKSQFVLRAAEKVCEIHQSEGPGDILVFLTGQQDIETTCRLISETLSTISPKSLYAYPEISKLSIHPIYSALETSDQRSVFLPPRQGYRKVVVATNIAQTSVTIPGIRFVVDSGFVKEKSFHPKTGVDALLVVPISRAAALQRAGRAGRTGPGKVFRLYSRDAFDSFDENTTPEIQRSSLLGTVLSLKEIGINDVLNFQFIDPPEPSLLITALKQLYFIDALDEDGNLTSDGHKMSMFPVSPFLARAILASCDGKPNDNENCGEEMITIAAMLSVEDIFVVPRGEAKKAEAAVAHARFGGTGGKGFSHSGDHIALLRIFAAFLDSGESTEWCREHYLRHRSLRMAKTVKDQLKEIVTGKLKLKLGSCRQQRSQEKSNKSRRVEGRERSRDDHYDDEQDLHLEDYDARPILRAICSGQFLNTARKDAHRSFFYHYLATAGLRNNNMPDSNDSSETSLISLYVHPSSCLSEQASKVGSVSQLNGLDWVIYQDLQFVTRANMRIVSRIDFSWVQPWLKRVMNCNVDRLIGKPISGRPRTQQSSSTADETLSKAPMSTLQGRSDGTEQEPADTTKETQYKPNAESDRQAKVDAARERYLARKKRKD